MKKISILLILIIGVVVTSCSNDKFDNFMPLEKQAIEKNSMAPRFTEDNLTNSTAIAFATEFLKRTTFFYVKSVIGFEPSFYIQYNNSFSVSFSGKNIQFRGISCSVMGNGAGQPFGIYSGGPTTDYQITSLGNQPIMAEVIYDKTLSNERSTPVGKRYCYDTNLNGSECWIMVQWASVSDFEAIIGW